MDWHFPEDHGSKLIFPFLEKNNVLNLRISVTVLFQIRMVMVSKVTTMNQFSKHFSRHNTDNNNYRFIYNMNKSQHHLYHVSRYSFLNTKLADNETDLFIHNCHNILSRKHFVALLEPWIFPLLHMYGPFLQGASFARLHLITVSSSLAR